MFQYYLELFENLRVSENSPIFYQRIMFYLKKIPPTKVESLPMMIFDLNQTREEKFSKNRLNRTFSTTATRYICTKSLRKVLTKFDKKDQIIKVLKRIGQITKKKCYADNHGQNILNTTKKSSKTGQEKKTLITAFT